MRRVIYAWNYVEWGGAQIYTLALIQEARKLYDVTVVLPHGSSDELLRFLDQAAIKYEFFGPPGDFDSARTLFRRLQRRWRKLRSEGALVRHLIAKDLRHTILHVDLSPTQSFFSLLSLCSRTHVFFTAHNAGQPFPRWREMSWAAKIRLLCRTGRFHIFCANENTKEYLLRFASEETAKSFTVTRAGVDTVATAQILKSDFDRDAVLSQFGLAADKTIVLTVGQFIDRKGRWPYLETIRKITRKRKDIQFLWLMPKFPGDLDSATIEEYEVGEYFKMILSSDAGASRTEILKFFRVADIYVLPSFVEGVPISLLEAMALGLPSISTRINGIPEAIESGKTGLLVEPGDVDGLEKAILQLVEDPTLRDEFALHGQSFVTSRFDERAGAEDAVNEYDKISRRNMSSRHR